MMVAEFVGTLLFQLIGGGVTHGQYNGLILMVLIFFFGAVCSAAFNPAVALGLWIAGNLSMKETICYMIAEFSGALLGALIAGGVFFGGCHIGDYSANAFGLAGPEACVKNTVAPAYASEYYSPPADIQTYASPDSSSGYDRHLSTIGKSGAAGISNGGSGCVLWHGAGESDEISTGQLFGLEFFGTFFLMLTIMGVAIFPVYSKKVESTAAIAIGFALYVCINSFGSLSGGAFNPARQFAPAVVFGCGLSRWYVYWLAEFAGAAVAALFGNWILQKMAEVRERAKQKPGIVDVGSSMI